MLKVLAAEDSVDSSHFVMRTARTQGIGQGGKKRAYLLGPTKSRQRSNLAVLGLKLGRTGAYLGPTWAYLT